jgi:excinuclease ABC subunit B
MRKFELASKFKPAPAQQDVIAKLYSGLEAQMKHQTLTGVTGSGKTFVMANIIEKINKPTLILAHNKTLAAQLFAEFKNFFPNNAVKYFISYYDYYQPEAYIPQRDLYIEKESEVNKTIEKYRNAATQALLTRSDTLIVASVSCIYGLGDPEDYETLSRDLEQGMHYNREKLLRHLSDMQYERTVHDFAPGTFRVRGDNVEVYLSSSDEALRIEYFGDQIESLKTINPLTGEVIERPSSYRLFPAKHFVTPYESLKAIIPQIREDLKQEVKQFMEAGKKIEAYRLEQRVNFDMEMMVETGYCSGIENYSRYIDRREPGTPPSTLIDYFPDDWLLFVDESHITLPQVRGMYNGDKMRKENLVNYGFRLKAALDNRPLKYHEFQTRLDQVIYTSATPDEEELNYSVNPAIKLSDGSSYIGKAELLIRPTGLLDPLVDIRPPDADSFETLKHDCIVNKYLDMSIVKQEKHSANQIDDLINEIKNTVAKGQRVLVTTLTKRMAEDLAGYLTQIGIKVTYIHSDLDSIKRVEILKNLRLGKYDCLIGINLLREGLDLPEVSLVAIMDADKEGFLRSRTSLIQTMGRAARHIEGKVIMYASHITGSMKFAIDETLRRRKVQDEYNKRMNITPTGIIKEISDVLSVREDNDKEEAKEMLTLMKRVDMYPALDPKAQKLVIKELQLQMEIYADMQEYEKAAECRDLLRDLEQRT